MTTAIMIPARYGSTRYPGKPLTMLGDKPMIQRVAEACKATGYDTYVLTDNKTIAQAAQASGVGIYIDSHDYENGTERCAGAIASRKFDEYDNFINVQGDMPDVTQEMIEKCPEIYFEITPTVSMMNVWHLPDFHEDWIEKGFLQPGAVRINNLLDPKYFCMQVLPDDFKKEVTDKWLTHIEKVSNMPAYNTGINWVNEAHGMLHFLNKQNRSELISTTIREWETWDSVRNEKWYDALPELKFLENYLDK